MQDFELFLARQCAPLFFNMKPAALFAERFLPQSCKWEQMQSLGFRTFRLFKRHGNVLMLVYNPELLADALREDTAMQRLYRMGYPVGEGIENMLRHLNKRFLANDEFPHEVGFFLGYPAEDVIGFMEDLRGCKMCGMWKVYGDEECAKAMFERYALCKKVLLEHLQNGGSIFTLNLPSLAG